MASAIGLAEVLNEAANRPSRSDFHATIELDFLPTFFAPFLTEGGGALAAWRIWHLIAAPALALAAAVGLAQASQAFPRRSGRAEGF